MDPFFAYKIAHQGLKKEKHRFEFRLDDKFFGNFEHTQITDADILATMTLDTTHEPYVVDIEIEGQTNGDCDKCAATIPLKVRGDFKLFVKFTESAIPEDETDDIDIIYLTRDEPEIDFTQYLYEFAHLSLPVIKTCEKPFATSYCDMEVGRIMQQLHTEETNNDDIDPRWSALNKLKDKKG